MKSGETKFNVQIMLFCAKMVTQWLANHESVTILLHARRNVISLPSWVHRSTAARSGITAQIYTQC